MKPYTLTDAEAELRVAINDGDEEAMRALEPTIDRLDQATREVTALAAALWYAEHGMPVFPIAAGGKVPAIPSPHPKGSPERRECKGECGKDGHGCKDATTDPARIQAWWGRHPDANIGLATGFLFDVVDIDGALGQKSRAERWDDTFGRIDDDAFAKVLTPSPGGMHLYVPPTGDGNSAGIIPGVDYRGVGGYVVAPPSVTPTGSYRFLGAPRLDALAAQANGAA